jgi:hypothetical protein
MKKKKQPKAPTPKQLKTKLWDLCRKVADQQYPNAVCYTCGSNIIGANKQLGHFIPSSTCGALLRYDIRNLRWQCMRCNIHAGGNGAVYYRRMVEREGQAYVDKLFQDKQKTVKADILFFLNLIKEYEDLLR